jgi:hypothetical protein|tara:strand:+ start:421 stop:552 length:132 start_codon:yes stop_codon:yes gene_type:complete
MVDKKAKAKDVDVKKAAPVAAPETVTISGEKYKKVGTRLEHTE